MKRASVLIFLCLFLFSLAANSQDYYAVSSPEWKAVDSLCHYAGVTGPSSNGPVTKAQLVLALDRAEDEIGAEDAFLLYVRSLLSDEDATITDGVGSVTISLEGNAEDYALIGDLYDADVFRVKDRYTFLSPSRERSPLFNVGAEFSLLDYAYGRFNYNFTRDEFSADIWNSRFSTNLSLVFSQSFPYDAGISIGTDNLNIMAAKGKASLGEGYTGNTAVGDNYDYQEFVKASLFSPYMGLYLRLTSFDSSHDASLTDNPYALVSSRFSGWKQLRHEMGFEILFTGNTRLTASLINLLDTTSSFDVRMLNPFSVIHNMFNYTDHTVFESNNMLTIDFSYSPVRKWNLYFQFSLDQSQSKGEVEAYGEKLDPNAFAYLFNVSWSDYISDGILNVYLEGVCTDPGMYLNTKYYASADDDTVTVTDNGRYCWSQDWLLGYWRNDSYGDVNYSGYIYGPDCIVVVLGSGYTHALFSVEGRVMYMAHGEKGRGSSIDNYTFSGINSRATYNTKTPYGTVEHTALVSIDGEYNMTQYLSLSLGAAYSYIWNYGNESGRNRSSLELVFGVTIKGTVPTILRRDR